MFDLRQEEAEGRVAVSAVQSVVVNGDTVLVTTHNCIQCGNPGQVRVPVKEYAAWENGGLIQSAMPSLSAAERELIISGTHGECYDKIFDAGEEEYSEVIELGPEDDWDLPEEGE